MYSIARTSEFCLRTLTLPKYCIIQINSTFETYSKTSGDINSLVPRDSVKNKVIPKYVHNFHLPMGSKKGSFKERSSQRREISREILLKFPVEMTHRSVQIRRQKQEPTARESFNINKEERKIETVDLSDSRDVVMCKTSNTIKKESDSKEPKKPNLELISYLLTNDLTNFFMQRQDWSIYHKDIVFQDNIAGEILLLMIIIYISHCFRNPGGWS